jgi:hypothetical protein
MRRRKRTASRDYLVYFSAGVTSLFLVGFLLISVAMLLVHREHVAGERANRLCAERAPVMATGWQLDYDEETETYTCTYDRNGRRIGRHVAVHP